VQADIDGSSLVAETETIINLSKHFGLMIARFCFHDNLFVIGNRRACLVEISSIKKPVAVLDTMTAV